MTLADGSITNVQVSTNINYPFTINVGERVRYHISAEKVGTAASNITESLYLGTSYNSYIDIAVPLNSDNVTNLSSVTGANVTEALDNLKNSIPTSFTQIVYVNATNPNAATIFDLNNPPVTNNNALKADVTNLYIGTDASNWVYNSTTMLYVTKALTSNTSNFYLAGTTTDAQGNKTAAIERTGTVGGAQGTAANHFVTKAQLDTKVGGTGVSGQVSFWNGTSTQTGDNGLFWDNINKRLGYGTNAPSGAFEIKHNGGTIAGIVLNSVGTDSGRIRFTNNDVAKWDLGGTVTSQFILENRVNSTRVMTAFEATNNISIGHSTDDGVNKLQINGSGISTAWKVTGGLATQYQTGTGTLVDFGTGVRTTPLTGYVSGAGTITATDNILQAIQKLNGNAAAAARPYKVYTALVSQTGTSAPVATVLENTLGGTISYSVSAGGYYKATLTGANFTNLKTVVFFTNGANTANTLVTLGWLPINISELQLITKNNGTMTNDCIANASLEIRVYN